MRVRCDGCTRRVVAVVHASVHSARHTRALCHLATLCAASRFFTLAFALVTLKGGIIKHMRTPYARMPEYHPHAWQFGVAINLYGLAAYLYGCVMAIVAGALESAAFWVWLVLAVIVVVLLHVRKAKQGTPSDAAWYNQKGGLTAVHTTKRHVEMTS